MARPKKRAVTAVNKKLQRLPGMRDLLPIADHAWDLICQKLDRQARAFGYSRIEVPLLEHFSLYEHLDKEERTIINFNDPEGNKVAVRPDILPGLMRAYSEQKFPEDYRLSKFYYLAPSVAYDERQKKFIDSWEYGFELFGNFSPLMEVQLMNLTLKFLKSLGLPNLSLEVNSIGKTESRKDYDETLSNYLQSKKYELCNRCAASVDSYPLQVFRCNNLECKTVAAEAPPVVDFLDEESHKHFAHILEALDELGIGYNLNSMLVGEQGTVFSIKYRDELNEYFIGEGAGHAELYRETTGKNVYCFGFSGNAEIIYRALQGKDLTPHLEFRPEVFLVPLGDLASKKALRLFSELWDENIIVHDHFGDNGVKNQLKLAETYKAMLALIIGQKEAMDGMVILRDVKSGMQELYQHERIIDEVKKRLGK